MLSMRRQASKGFTLVEVLIIAPIVILAISAFVALLVTIVSDVLVTRSENTQVYDTQNALDIIEQDVRLSTNFPATTGPLPSPQGKNNNFTGTTAFESTDTNTLILNTVATDRNPADSSRSLLYYANQPNPCTSSDINANPTVIYNRVFLVTNIYFVKDGALWKRTYVPSYDTNLSNPTPDTICASPTTAPWQRNTCSPGYTDSRCRTQDTRLISNVNNLSVQYFATGDSTTDLGAANAEMASTIEATIAAATTTTGEDIETTMTRRMSKLSRISPADASAQWRSLTLQNSWVRYQTDWNDPAYIKTTGCVVFLKGLVTRAAAPGTNSIIAQLPPGYRPSENLVYPTSTRNPAGGSQPGRIDIDTSGNVRYFVGNVASGGWMSLDGISFMPNDGTCPSLSPLPLQNGWTNYDATRVLKVGADTMGRTHLRGLIVPGTITSGTTIANIPPAMEPVDRYYYFTGGAPNQQYTYYGLRYNVGLVARGIASDWLAVQAMFYNKDFTGWSNLSLQNGWENYNTTSFPLAQYTKAADGVVTVQGAIKSGNVAANTVIANLPPGYRPAKRTIFSAVLSGARYGRLDILPNGNIIVQQANATWTTLSDIKFVAEQ